MQYVECYWFLEKDEVSNLGNFPKLNPDSSAQLILAPKNQAYNYQSNNHKFEGKGSHWITPHSQMHQMDHTDPFMILGIKFHVGAMHALALDSLELKSLDIALNQIVDCDFNVLFNNQGAVTETKLLNDAQQSKASNLPTFCQQLDLLLEPWLLNAHKDKHSKLVDRVLPILSRTAISDVGSALNCSQRTVERSFLKWTGFTLKQCQSINKFEAMLEHVTNLAVDNINWAIIAHDYGFSDQPHLIRYVKAIIEVTPGEYSKQRDLTIDIYGDFKQDSLDS